MTNHFYAVFHNYYPNSAPSNRALSYLEAWEKTDVKVTAVFMLPDRKYSRIYQHYKNVKILYMWDIMPFRNYFLHNLCLFWYVRNFIRLLTPGDKVYCMGQNYLMSRIVERSDVEVYQERTECPEIVESGVWPYKVKLKRYLFCCKKLKGMFVISQNLKDYFVTKGIEESKVHIVNMTVDNVRFEGIEKKEQNKYIAYCGKASNNKDGVDQLIKSFAIVCKKYPDIKLYVIGQAPNKNEKNYNAELAASLGVSEKVVFTGVAPYKDMPQMLTNATILALNRPDNIQAKYGFPTKLGEYLLTGNPVVVTAVGDIPRFIMNGVNGMVAKPDCPEDFASKIDWLLSHPNEAKKIGINGKQVAIHNFNNEVESRKIIDVLFS